MARGEPGITERVAAWATSLRYEDIPEKVLERARLQLVSVLAAIVATSKTDLHPRLVRAARRWGSGDEATILPSGPRSTLHAACYVNAASSVAYDFDDYLFAGHTGHSAVVGSLAVAEALGLDGRSMIATQVAANEIGGRLGASALLGPHNGQMWAYIHNIAGAVSAGRALGLDTTAMRDAFGIALAQPPYPLAAGFFGPDSKALLASGPLVDGIHAAELAAEGLTGNRDVLEGEGGFLKTVPRKSLSFAFDALGSAWVTQSLAFKTIPGCAYIDTPVEALEQIMQRFAREHGRALAPDDVGQIRVDATLFTNGMEKMSTPHRGTRVRATDVNFSVKLSFGVLIAAGEISVETLSQDALDARASEISAVAAHVSLKQNVALNLKMSGLSEIGINPIRLVDPTYKPSLDGADFGKYEMRFPARVTLQTTDGTEYTAEVDAPVGAPGRPLDETTNAVRQKFLRAADGVVSDPKSALEAMFEIDGDVDIPRLVSLITEH
jgi:2-methylcitrate dehydratase PrpD